MPSSDRASRPAFERGHPNVGWLFPDPIAAASDYYARTGIFPIMHIVGVRRIAGRSAPVVAGRRA
jgi:4,5-dihydroxyphthalate decarboxylase